MFQLRKSICYESFESEFSGVGGGVGGLDLSFSFKSIPMLVCVKFQEIVLP